MGQISALPLWVTLGKSLKLSKHLFTRLWTAYLNNGCVIYEIKVLESTEQGAWQTGGAVRGDGSALPTPPSVARRLPPSQPGLASADRVGGRTARPPGSAPPRLR